MATIHNARFGTLQIAYTDLMNASNRSSFITVLPVDAMEGWPAEKYVITYTCKGIARLTPEGLPVYSEHHEMKLELSSSFPANEPSILWMTDIWHPNIGRQTRHVCTNEIATWYPQKSLMDFLVGIGEMIQYKHYFARAEPPFPEDPEVAKWVREVAEPRGLFGRNKPVDDRPMLKEQRIRKVARRSAEAEQAVEPAVEEKPVRRIVLGLREGAIPASPLSPEPRAPSGRIKLGLRTPPA